MAKPRNPYYDGPRSDHFDGLRFFNPHHPPTDRSLGDMWRWKSARGAVVWPSSVDVQVTKPHARVDGLRVTMVGHATLLVQVAGLNILTDPLWSERASPVSFAGPRRVTRPGIAFDDLPPIDVALVSHNHYDHLDVPTLKRLQARDRPLIVTPFGNDTIIGKAVPAARVRVGDWDDRIDIGGGASVVVTAAYHWSSRSLSDRRMALWGGFKIDTPSGSVWFAGDTGYGDGVIFKELRERHGAPDVALIPIGAYDPRWFMAAQHTDPVDAVKIFHDVGARRAIGIHWGTFQLTDEGRDAPKEALAAALATSGIAADRFVAAEPGQSFDYSDVVEGAARRSPRTSGSLRPLETSAARHRR